MAMRRLGSLARTVLVTSLFAGVAHAADSQTASVTPQALHAKILYCETCHGIQAQGFRGAFPIPRLAGQQPEYIQNQLKAFIEKRRTNAVMFRVAHVLSPAMVAELAAHFKTLDPKPLTGSATRLTTAGKETFEHGIPSENVPACSSCHGPDAKGAGEFPRLAGQLDDYVIAKLTHWSQERGQDPEKPDPSAIMAPIAHELTKEQITAVAAYLSHLE